MEKIRRLEIIINLLGRRLFFTKQEIIEHFIDHYEVNISARTLERDFKDLEINYHIKVKYDRQHLGYYLLEEDEQQVADFLAFAGRVYLAELFKQGLKNFEDLQQTIKLESHGEFEGISFVEPIFLAIRQQRKIKFTHENYLKNTFKDYQIAPLQLREYQGRWYVVGVLVHPDKYCAAHNEIRIFGLARISRLEVKTPFSLNPEDYYEQLEKFTRIIGLNYDEGEKQEIIDLVVTKNQYKYLASLPLHQSQQKIGHLPDGRIHLQLFMIPNYELKMQFLKLGNQVEVLKPNYLRKEIQTILQQALTQYTR